MSYTPQRAATQVEHPWRATLRNDLRVLRSLADDEFRRTLGV